MRTTTMVVTRSLCLIESFRYENMPTLDVSRRSKIPFHFHDLGRRWKLGTDFQPGLRGGIQVDLEPQPVPVLSAVTMAMEAGASVTFCLYPDAP